MRQGFFDKFISKLDRIDAPVASAHIATLAKERGFLETLFQSINEGILVLGDEMRLLYANAAAERFIGFTAEKERGHSMKRYLRDWGIETLLRQQFGDWKRVETREVEVSYPEQRVISFYARPVEFEDRTELLLMLRDITRERRAEEDTLADERIGAVKTLVAACVSSTMMRTMPNSDASARERARILTLFFASTSVNCCSLPGLFSTKTEI